MLKIKEYSRHFPLRVNTGLINKQIVKSWMCVLAIRKQLTKLIKKHSIATMSGIIQIIKKCSKFICGNLIL